MITGNVSNPEKVYGNIGSPKYVRGASAYEVAVANGFKGTEKEWLDSLKADSVVYTLSEGETIADAPANADIVIDPYADEDTPLASGVYTLTEGETIEDVPPEFDVVIDPYAEPEIPEADISLNVEGASVGQIVKVAAVDEAGKPTAWEAVDMPSGGGEWKYTHVQQIVTEDNVSLIEFDGLGQYDEALLLVDTPWNSAGKCTATVLIDGKQVEKDWYNFQDASMGYINSFYIKRIAPNVYHVEVTGISTGNRWGALLKVYGYTLKEKINSIGFSFNIPLTTGGYSAPCKVMYFAR